MPGGCNRLCVVPSRSLDGKGGRVPWLVCRLSLSPSVFLKLLPAFPTSISCISPSAVSESESENLV